MSGLSEEDKLLFNQAMSGVNPLNTTHLVDLYADKPKVRIAKNLLRSHQTVQPDHTSIAEIDLNVEAVNAHQSLMFHRKGLRLQDLARLKKGEFHTSWTLDLHGHKEQDAVEILHQFIQAAYQTGARYALVVHGKGYNSDTEYPVIKNLVNQQLRRLKLVIAFCSAQQKDGGTGAVYVMLKAK